MSLENGPKYHSPRRRQLGAVSRSLLAGGGGLLIGGGLGAGAVYEAKKPAPSTQEVMAEKFQQQQRYDARINELTDALAVCRATIEGINRVTSAQDQAAAMVEAQQPNVAAPEIETDSGHEPEGLDLCKAELAAANARLVDVIGSNEALKTGMEACTEIKDDYRERLNRCEERLGRKSRLLKKKTK